MLSIYLIERHFELRRFDALLRGLAANGLPLPLPLQARLGRSPVPAVALGLRRVLELTYGPTALSHSMARFLLDAQEAGSLCDPLSAATAAAAIGRLLRDHLGDAQTEALERTREQVLATLAAFESHEPDRPGFRDSDDRTQQDRDLTTAFILALLADDEAFRRSVRFAEMMNDFEQRQETLDAATQHLWLMAQVASSTPSGGRQRAMPAQAAAA